jgi:ABC-type Fe3+-hydroxamate transport system substrate-binding protein
MHSVRTTVGVLLATLALAFAAGCSTSGNGTSTNCSTTACTVTFDQGVNAEANILGVKAKLIGVQGQQVTVEVAGQRVQVAAGQPVDVGAVRVTVQEITAQKVVLQVSQAA